MIRAISLTMALSLMAGASAAAQTVASLAPERPALRASATVTGDVVRIGDLIDHAGIIANVPIFRAPDLGATGSVSAAQVIEAVKAHALIGLDPNGIDEITVTRASRAIPVSDIEQQIVARLSGQYSLGDGKGISLKFDRALHTVHVDANAKGELQVAGINYDRHSGRFDAVVEIAGAPASRLRFSGTAIATAEVFTVTRPITRGDVVRRADIAAERRPRAEIAADVLTSADQIVGRAARVALGPGRPLRAADLAKPELVQRNEAVTLIYEAPGLMLTVRGKANEAGSEGDLIEVLNVQSKRTVHGIVTGPGRVVVSGLVGNTLAANTTEPSSTPSKAAVPAR